MRRHEAVGGDAHVDSASFREQIINCGVPSRCCHCVCFSVGGCMGLVGSNGAEEHQHPKLEHFESRRYTISVSGCKPLIARVSLIALRSFICALTLNVSLFEEIEQLCLSESLCSPTSDWTQNVARRSRRQC